MDQATHNKIVSFIWGIADDVLRDLFVRGKYRDVILPMCVLRCSPSFPFARRGSPMLLRWLLVLGLGCVLIGQVGAESASKPRLDTLGDPLPEGAVARLGTLRLKHGPFSGSPFSGSVVHKVVFSSDGTRFASLDTENTGTLRVWDRTTGKELPGPWSADGFRFAAMALATADCRAVPASLSFARKR